MALGGVAAAAGCVHTHSMQIRPDEDVARASLGPRITSEVILYALPALMTLALCLRPDNLSDLGWQLKLGGSIVSHSTPFIHEEFAVGHLGEPLLPNAWLGQLAFFIVDKCAGMTALLGFNLAIWLSGLLLPAFPAWKRGEPALGIVLALLTSFVVALPAASARPQSFASLAFGLTLILIRNLTVRRAVCLGAPLFVLWQNFHPSVSVAVAIAGALAALEWAKRFTNQNADPVPMTVLFFIAVGAVLATPAGVLIIPMAAHNAKVSIMMGASEWYPAWDPYNNFFLILILLSVSVAAYIIIRRKSSFSDVIPVLITLIMSLVAVRFILFFAIALVPLLAGARIGQPALLRPYWAAFASSTAAAICLFLMPVRLDQLVPQVAIRELRQGDVIYSDTFFGGELIDAGYKVALDGRYYIYSEPELELFMRTNTDSSTLAQIESKYHPAAYILKFRRSAALIHELEKRMQWKKVYLDNEGVSFLRKN